MNLFEEYITKKRMRLFTGNREILMPSYIPERLPHREKEVSRLGEILAPSLEGVKPSNVFIYGKTGTGKTAVVKYVLRDLERVTTVHNLNVRSIYLNCETVDTHYSVLQNIGNFFMKKWDERIPFTGWPMEKVYETVKDKLNDFGGIFIVVLDEIDKLITKSGDDVLYHLLNLNDELTKARVSLIGISNNIQVTQMLDARVKSRLSQERILFPPYNASQLKDILMDRVRLANAEDVFSEEVIGLCAALAAQEHGDARRAIDLLRISLEMAEREGAVRVLPRHVYEASSQIELSCVAEAIRTLPIQQKLVLLSILLNSEMGKINQTTGEVYATYSKIAKMVGMQPVTQRRVTDFISELDSLGLISASLKSFGRYGRTKVINPAIPVDEAKEVITEDPFLEDMKNIKLPKQTVLH